MQIIKNFVELNLTINGKTKRTPLLVTRLGKQKIILYFPWLNKMNPDINWKTGKFLGEKPTTNEDSLNSNKMNRNHELSIQNLPLKKKRTKKNTRTELLIDFQMTKCPF